MEYVYIILILVGVAFVGGIVIIISVYFYKKELELTEIKKSSEKKEFDKVIKL